MKHYKEIAKIVCGISDYDDREAVTNKLADLFEKNSLFDREKFETACMGKLSKRVKQELENVAKLRAEIRQLNAVITHMDRKAMHKCIDAYCEQCDGPREHE